jgi:hypothetical protein
LSPVSVEINHYVVNRNLKHFVFSVEDLDFVKIRNLDDVNVISVEINHYVVNRNLKHFVFNVEDLTQKIIHHKIFYKFYKILIKIITIKTLT